MTSLARFAIVEVLGIITIRKHHQSYIYFTRVKQGTHTQAAVSDGWNVNKNLEKGPQGEYDFVASRRGSRDNFNFFSWQKRYF